MLTVCKGYTIKQEIFWDQYKISKYMYKVHLTLSRQAIMLAISYNNQFVLHLPLDRLSIKGCVLVKIMWFLEDVRRISL